jgi:hypothetical protein
LPALKIDVFPWHKSGAKQETTLRACYSHTRLYLLFQCQDRHISASRTALNSDVCNDSCVEFFASVPEEPGNYFNLEINCCGALHLGYGPGRHKRRMVTPEQATRIGIFHSVPGPARQESRDDSGWAVQVGLPFDFLSDFIGRPVSVQTGTLWRANFYRCGGLTDPQFACWSPVGTPRPDFHRPEYFGKLQFSD